jgi:Reverse transcriptase (RNA-dependent DNA polymerase)
VSEDLAALLDLPLAWGRIKDDLRSGLIFIDYPNEVALIEWDLDGWLAQLQADIASGDFHPGSQTVLDVPKARGAIRPGSQLSLRDCLVYYATVGACLPRVIEHLRWAFSVDFSHRLTHDASRRGWITNQYKGWSQFREQSLKKLDEGYTYVVIADIASYYENVDLGTLASDLRSAGCSDLVVSALSAYLNRWAQAVVPGRSICQGFSASDILGKLYLDSVDHNLRALGYDHFRYVDDIRVFCRSLPEARRVLVDLAGLLRRRGLQLATQKLEIFRADQARSKIAGIAPIIHTVQSKLVQEVVAAFGLDNPYLETWEVDQVVSANPDEAPVDLIRQTYQSYFVDTAASFNHTLFRYLFKRLGSAADTYALEDAKLQFDRNPQETRAILRYVNAVGGHAAFEDFLGQQLGSERAVYSFQIYQVLRWYLERQDAISERMLAVVREYAFDETVAPYVRVVARALVGAHGNPADLERLQGTYDSSSNSLEGAELMCALARMERGRRNAFLARAAGDGELQRRAAGITRAV